MSQNLQDFNVGVIGPVECLKESWELIKDEYWLILGVTFVGLMVGGTVPIVLMGPMMCGMYLCLLTKMRRQPVDFGLLFKGFDYFGQSVIASLLQMIPAVIILVPFYIIFLVIMFAMMPSGRGRVDPDESAAFAFAFFAFYIIFILVIVAVALVIHIFFMFSYPLIVDRNLSGVEAVKLSIKAGKANFGGLLGLMFLNMGLGILGALACYVGAFFVMPITFTSYAVAYRRIFPEMPQTFPSPPPPPQTWT